MNQNNWNKRIKIIKLKYLRKLKLVGLPLEERNSYWIKYRYNKDTEISLDNSENSTLYSQTSRRDRHYLAILIYLLRILVTQISKILKLGIPFTLKSSERCPRVNSTANLFHLQLSSI